MATIKQIAEISGFSPTTVSIVLRGKANERHISEETRTKILETAQQLGYRANIAARRLRTNKSSSVVVSVFMALDQRSYAMMRFLRGLQSAAIERDLELVVHSYKSGSLHLYREAIELNNCVIICNASKDDLQFLERTSFAVPIVLFFRTSKKYNSVSVNLANVGKMAAETFARHGNKHVAVLAAPSYFSGLDQCISQLTKTAKDNKMTVTIIDETHDAQGGYNGGNAMCKMAFMPDCIFCVSSIMILGALRAFEQQNIKIPEQVELITMGTENPELEEYASVAISSISVPIELMARECIKLLFLQLDDPFDEPCVVEVPVAYHARESCGK